MAGDGGRWRGIGVERSILFKQKINFKMDQGIDVFYGESPETVEGEQEQIREEVIVPSITMVWYHPSDPCLSSSSYTPVPRPCLGSLGTEGEARTK